MGPMDWSTARRHPKHSRDSDDADGRALLAYGGANRLFVAAARNRLCVTGCLNNRHAHAAALGELASEISAMAVRNLYQWRAHLQRAAALAFPDLPVVRLRVCWASDWL